jgi:hypothetical protein
MIYAQEKFGEHIVKNNPGYTYLGETKIFCPYFAFGVESIKRTETALSYVYETILRFVDLGVNSVPELCQWLGLNESVLAEIASDMAVKTNLIDTSSQRIMLTTTGKEALCYLKTTILEKFQFNNLCVNSISGEIYEATSARLINRPPKGYMYLDSLIEVDLRYINSKFEILSEIFNKRNEEDEFTKSTLFRMISMVYSDIRYKAMTARIFVHDSNRNLLVIFPFDNDFEYAPIVYDHLSKKNGGYKWLGEGECTRLRNLSKLDLSAERFDNELRRLVDAYQGGSDSVEDGVTFDTQYYVERRLLSGEAFDLLMSSHDFSSKEITILSAHLVKYITDDALVAYWGANLGGFTLRLAYPDFDDVNSMNLRKIVENFIEKLPQEKRRFVSCVPINDEYDRTIIVCNPGYAIMSSYEYINIANSKEPLVKENSCVSFNSKMIQKWNEMVSSTIEQQCK